MNARQTQLVSCNARNFNVNDSKLVADLLDLASGPTVNLKVFDTRRISFCAGKTTRDIKYSSLKMVLVQVVVMVVMWGCRSTAYPGQLVPQTPPRHLVS